jgi:hypothetical protein
VWRPNHFATGIDAFSNAQVGNIFTGVNVDVGVREAISAHARGFLGG